MNFAFLKAVVASAPAGVLFWGSAVWFTSAKTAPAFLQLLGAGGLVLVVLKHFCEALHLFPWMHWRAVASIGHYVDLCCALVAVTLFPVGYLLHAVATRRT